MQIRNWLIRVVRVNATKAFHSTKQAPPESRVPLGGRGSRRAVESLRVPTSRLSGSFALPRNVHPTNELSRRCFYVLLIAIALVTVSSTLTASEPGWKAGTAKKIVTPQKPLWMAGYGSRTAPSEGTLQELLVRALALEDSAGHRGIILSSDLLGIPKAMYDEICAALKKKHGLDRAQILLHASHTHCGPALERALHDIYPVNEEQKRDIAEYSAWLTTQIVATIGEAIGNLQPATLSRGVGATDFAVNRRTNREPDVPKLREQNLLMGPVDHTVPVLAVHTAEGKLKAVVFMYACHNTTLSFQKWCGDYAGFAQFQLEEKHPGALAMFCMGCGADQNPLPRRTVELCQTYGKKLADEVDAVLEKPLTPVRPTLEMQHTLMPLVMDPLPATNQLEKMASEPPSYTQRWASRLLTDVRNGVTSPREYPFPIQAWRLGGDLLWISLGGEVVIDYALRLKAEYGDQIWISAYANDVMAYIPSKRVLLEGGYEGQSSMMVYGMPTERWSTDVEDRVMQGVEKVVTALER